MDDEALTQARGEARLAQERFRALFDHGNDAVSIVTLEGIVLEVNARWGELLGCPSEELVGLHVRDFAAAGHEDPNFARFVAVSEGGSGRVPPVPIRRRSDGATIYLEFAVAVIELDGRRVALTIGHDMTQEVLAATSLTDAEQRYKSLLERIPDVIWAGAADGSITFVTPNVEAMLGYTAAEFCAQAWETRLGEIHPEDRARVDEAWRRLVGAGVPMDLEYRKQRKDGTWIWVHNRILSNRVRNGGREIEGILSDISERRRLESSVVQAQKMEALGQLTGGIAHDFNNLLAAILANSHFLVEDLGEHDPRRQYADEVRIAAERGAGLTRQLLAFSRRQVMEPCVVDLNSIVVGMEKMLRRLIGEDFELATALAPAPGTARVDVGQLEQVILNLVVNARDAMTSGGVVTIETRNEQIASSSEVPVPPGRYVVLAVTDVGCGMDAETKRRMFEPFFTTKALDKGTGLGLSTCYGIVQQSGGHITVDSAPGRGTRFEVFLPRVDERRPLRTPTAMFEAQGTETILLIEDDDRVRRAIERILEPQGYRLLVARNGAEALSLAESHDGPIDLVLSDVVMPGLSGPAVVAQLREIDRAPRVLFMSGYTQHDTLDRNALQHRRNFLQKPFAPNALLKKLREVLDTDERD